MTHKEHIEQLIIEGKLEIAIKELLRGTKENGQKDLQNGLILLSARNSSNENEKKMETISNGDYNREKAKITASLLYYLEKYHPSQNIPFKDDNTEENSNKPSISEIQNNMPTIHTLTGKQKKAFKIALVSAFPIVTELNQMTNIVFDKSLNQIVSPGNIEHQAFELINWAISQGKLEQLINGALEEVPGNIELKKFKATSLTQKSEINVKGNNGVYIDNTPNTKVTITKQNTSNVDGNGNFVFQDVNSQGNIELNINKTTENEKSEDRKKVLMIFSTPKSEDTLRFNDEVKIVTDKLSYSKLFLLESPKYKVENIEIAPNIITEEPNIVHFSLHGKKNKGLVFSDRYENASIVNLIEFKNTLDILGGAKIDCFIFNVCHSNEFAKLASTYATYAIGMNDLINEPDAAVAFSEGFYSMLKVVDNIETAFRAAVNLLYNRRIQLKQADRKEDYKVPELFKNGDLLLDAEILNLK